ncbi:endoplasmic oxidoreductin-1 [Conglomerata obtusa]
MQIYIFITLSVCTGIRTSFDILNSSINDDIVNLLKHPLFSSIVIDLSRPCASESIREACKTYNCVRPSILDDNQTAPKENYELFIDEPGTRIDLKRVVPDYTGYKAGAHEIWDNVYKISGGLWRLISGIHFSVTVHKAANFVKKDGKYLSNLGIYKDNYREMYRFNLYMLYIVVRSAVLRVKMVEAQSIVNKLKLQGDIIVNWKDLWSDYEIFFDSADQYLDCIECGTCKMWGKIQFYGLKTAIDILKEKEVSNEQIIFLLNFFGKLSNTLESIKDFDKSIAEEANKNNQYK